VTVSVVRARTRHPGSSSAGRNRQRATLERAVEGLTAGIPVSKNEFERRILAKLTRRVAA